MQTPGRMGDNVRKALRSAGETFIRRSPIHGRMRAGRAQIHTVDFPLSQSADSQVRRILEKISVRATGTERLKMLTYEAAERQINGKTLLYLRGWLHFEYEWVPGHLKQDSEPFMAVYENERGIFHLAATRPHWKDFLFEPDGYSHELVLIAGSPYHTLYPEGWQLANERITARGRKSSAAESPSREWATQKTSKPAIVAKLSLAMARLYVIIGWVSPEMKLSEFGELGAQTFAGRKPIDGEEMENSGAIWTMEIEELPEYMKEQHMLAF